MILSEAQGSKLGKKYQIEKLGDLYMKTIKDTGLPNKDPVANKIKNAAGLMSKYSNKHFSRGLRNKERILNIAYNLGIEDALVNHLKSKGIDIDPDILEKRKTDKWMPGSDHSHMYTKKNGIFRKKLNWKDRLKKLGVGAVSTGAGAAMAYASPVSALLLDTLFSEQEKNIKSRSSISKYE